MSEREVIPTVWVVMGNDYPCAVFSNEAAAKTYCKVMVNGNALDMKRGDARRIYYREYAFLLDQAGK